MSRTRAERKRAPIKLADMSGPPAIRLKPIVDKAGNVLREPTAERASWNDPDDRNYLSRTARQVNGARVANPLRNMMQRGGLVQLEHIVAATRLEQDYELSQRPGLGGMKLEFSPGGGGGVIPSERQMSASRRFGNAMQRVGDDRSCRLVAWVTLGAGGAGTDRTVGGWSRVSGVPERVAVGMLISALDRLVAYYEPRGNEEVGG